MADGNISLHGEGGEGQGRHVDPQVLAVHKRTAPHAAPDPPGRFFFIKIKFLSKDFIQLICNE